MTEPSDAPWKSCQTSHEGYPLMLRSPLEIPFHRQPDFPVLLAITHLLDEVTDSGLPESTYNARQADFDEAAIDAFQRGDDGVIVLVETFAGKRTYYGYVRASVDVDTTIAVLCKAFPSTRVEHSINENADWRFIRRYSADYSL